MALAQHNLSEFVIWTTECFFFKTSAKDRFPTRAFCLPLLPPLGIQIKVRSALNLEEDLTDSPKFNLLAMVVM